MKWLKNILVGVVLCLLATYIDSHFEEDKMKSKWMWLLNLALLGILIGLLGCTRVVYRDAPTPYVVIPDTVFSPCNGVSLCTIATAYCSEDNRPVILVRKGYSEGEQRQFTREHERAHEIQMSSDCKGTAKKYADSLSVRERMESEAYCAEARARLKAGKNLEMVMSWYSSMMFAIFQSNHLVCEMKPP